MAHPYYNPKVGDFVYPAYAPQKAGVIVEYTPNNNHSIMGNVKIKMANGNVLAYPESGLQDFNALIEDHKKKLATHLVTLGKLQAIKETI